MSGTVARGGAYDGDGARPVSLQGHMRFVAVDGRFSAAAETWAFRAENVMRSLFTYILLLDNNSMFTERRPT